METALSQPDMHNLGVCALICSWDPNTRNSKFSFGSGKFLCWFLVFLLMLKRNQPDASRPRYLQGSGSLSNITNVRQDI